MAGIKYTAAQIDWLREHYTVYPIAKDLTAAFNRKFHCNRSICAIRQTAIRICGLKRCEKQLFTAEEDAWLIENYPKYKSTELTRRFIETFHHKSSPRNLICHCNTQLHIVSGRQDYPKGGIPHNVLPIGTERRTKEGYIIVKVRDKKSQKGDSVTYHENWAFKHTLVWEQHYGKVPAGYQVIFLDSDKENCSIENLSCIPKNIAALMSVNKWYTEDPELTLTAIKWCELYFTMKNTKGDKK